MRRLPTSPGLDERGLQRALERLREVVRARGLKNSSVREIIARAALTYEGHFSIDDLVRGLRGDALVDAHPATVYRVLPLLVEAGLIEATLVSSKAGSRYERCFEREHHDHLVCTKCGTVVEFCFEAIEVLQRDLAERFGFELTGHVHELFGTCRPCKQSDKASGGATHGRAPSR
ncbi:MAG: transcriptional repressor [Labilithrix sp.]|nr:transcriptional repressor [Labilithrix sp.]MCW5831442.1 transcriptional repressor [Labilithrix sp.]